VACPVSFYLLVCSKISVSRQLLRANFTEEEESSPKTRAMVAHFFRREAGLCSPFFSSLFFLEDKQRLGAAAALRPWEWAWAEIGNREWGSTPIGPRARL
jgi:hypothetical protein